MIKVLHIVQGLSEGGAVRAALALAMECQKSGHSKHSLMPLLPADSDNSGRRLAAHYGVQIIEPVNAESIQVAFDQHDIVQINWWNNPEMDSFLRGRLPLSRMLAWCHVGGHVAPQIVTDDLLYSLDFAVACSPYTLEAPAFQRVKKKYPHKVGMVYGAADLSRIRNITHRTHSGFNVGYLGTVHFIKMHRNFVKMCAAVKVPEANFIVCGTGGAEPTLKKEAEIAGLGNRFQLRGQVEDIASVIQDFDVYGYPLCEETYAASEMNLQEVMYAGVPVVVFPHGGVKRLVVNDFTGIVVHSEQEYSEAIEYLFHTPEERKRLGNNARLYATQIFGADNAARKITEIYETMMKRPKRMRGYGIDVEISILNQKVLLEDISKAKEEAIGSLRFITSLGDHGADFLRSMQASEMSDTIGAEIRIARSHEVMRSGSLTPFSSFYDRDCNLKLWAGLSMLGAENYHEALLFLLKAEDRGLKHWRIYWYIALAADKTGHQDIKTFCLNMLQCNAEEVSKHKDILYSGFPVTL